MSDDLRRRMNTDDHLPPAFYAPPRHLAAPLADWWLLLHPPYTLWHLSYVVIGACLAPSVDVGALLATVLAFFLAVGVAAHALDELHGRPLGTAIPSWALTAAAATGLGGAVVLGVLGIRRVGFGLVGFIIAGVVLALGYNLELFGGRLHTDTAFAASWGAFPLVTAYYTQHQRLDAVVAAAAGFAFFLAAAQRRLSTPARNLRRRTRRVDGTLLARDGSTHRLDRATMLEPLETALRALTATTVLLAVTLALARLTTLPG